MLVPASVLVLEKAVIARKFSVVTRRATTQSANAPNMAAYTCTNPNCVRFRGCGTFASSKARVLSRSQLSSARTVHELGNEAPLITVRTAYGQD